MTDTAAAIRSGAWATGAPAGAGVRRGGAPGIVGWALEYVQPLPQWFDDLTGDPGAIAAAGAAWRQAESNLEQVAADLRSARALLDTQDGRFVRVLETRYDDLLPVVHDAAGWMGAAAAAVDLALAIVEAVRTFIADFLVQLGRLVDALFGPTLNPFDKIEQLKQLVDAAGELIVAGQRLVREMLNAFARLIGLLSQLGPVIAEAMRVIREAIARMLPVAGALAGAGLGGGLGMMLGVTMGGGLKDLGMDLGPVRRLSPEELRAAGTKAETAKADAWDSSEKQKNLGTLSDLVKANGFTDAMGGSDSTAIDVKLVRAPDGTEHWVVSLPSTQEWLDLEGSGAMNDRDTNIELMLMENPVLKSQYERAVLQAMKEAGAAPGDPVVFTGFSQGGIMAANLASEPSLPYRPIGVVTNGSPVDSFHVPSNVPVIAFQHATDPVPALDGNEYGATASNVHRVVLPDPQGKSGIGAHDNRAYADSVANTPQGQAAQQMFGGLGLGGEVIDHQVFTAEQR
ncbi:MAG: hypothetical protein ABF811_07445 [Pseudoclavibacter sp.]